MNESVWAELTGRGGAAYEQRKAVYCTMVKHDQLWADEWQSPDNLVSTLARLVNQQFQAAAQGRMERF